MALGGFRGGQIQAGFHNTVTNRGGSASQFLEQISGLLVIWMGATLVLKGQLTLGQLIAFRILSGYVTSPLLQPASGRTSRKQLSHSRGCPTSSTTARRSRSLARTCHCRRFRARLPTRASICFASSGPLQLLNVSFEIKPGEFVGIVGSSGSGKSTPAAHRL